MFEWIQAIRQARYRLAQAISIPSSPKPEDLKVRRVTCCCLAYFCLAAGGGTRYTAQEQHTPPPEALDREESLS